MKVSKIVRRTFFGDLKFVEILEKFIESRLWQICKCDVLHPLVPFVQFKKREKHPWRSVILSKVAGFSLQLY